MHVALRITVVAFLHASGLGYRYLVHRPTAGQRVQNAANEHTRVADVCVCVCVCVCVVCVCVCACVMCESICVSYAVIGADVAVTMDKRAVGRRRSNGESDNAEA